MSIVVNGSDRIEMSQKDRDVLKVLAAVQAGKTSQAEAARLLDVTPRHVRRLQRRLTKEGDQAVIHGLRGKPSNHRIKANTKQRVLAEYRHCYSDFGPTLASEKLSEQGLCVAPETLRVWLLDEGLWQRRRHRDPHRRRRPRRCCFGELVQMDASIHDWLEGRGEPMVLATMIDDASNRIQAGFYPGETVVSYFDVLRSWLHKHGRPLGLYTDRDSIFKPHGQEAARAVTQFGRALRELGIGLTLAYSPQAKGRVERFFELAQDRWVKELRLAGACTREQANGLLRQKLIPEFNRRFTVSPESATDAHRELGKEHDLAAILSVQEQRVVANDYIIRFQNDHYQLLPPVWPGERGGTVIIEQRLDGSMAIRFKDHYLKFEVLPRAKPSVDTTLVSLPLSRPMPERQKIDRASDQEARSSGIRPTVGRSGRTPAEPYPPNGEAKGTRKGPNRPAKDHPWRRGFPKKG